MEKIFHLNQLAEQAVQEAPQLDGAQVCLKRQHLWIAAEVAENAFGGERQIYAVYYANMGSLLLAPMSDSLFKQAHECSLIMLKDRSLKGDKSMSLQEIIIDHELDGTDRALPFTGAPGLRMLQVKLA